MMKNKILMASALIILVGLISSISAFGVSSPYWNNNPLTMARGETKTVDLTLQNMVGDEKVNVMAEIISGEEILSLNKDAFVVESGTSEVIPVKITLSEEITPGTSTGVAIEFKTFNPDSEGGVALGTGMVISFNVVAGEEVDETNSTWKIIGIVLGLIVLIMIIRTLLPKKKKK